jgi:hypothetical protein
MAKQPEWRISRAPLDNSHEAAREDQLWAFGIAGLVIVELTVTPNTDVSRVCGNAAGANPPVPDIAVSPTDAP